MGTVLRILNVIFMIHTRDHNPPHVTVYQGNPKNFDAKARIEIETSEVMDSVGFSARALKKLQAVVDQEREFFMEKWNETRPEE